MRFYENMSFEHKQDRDNLWRVSTIADDYRGKYLLLRKVMRDYAKDNNLVLPDHIRKMIGMK